MSDEGFSIDGEVSQGTSGEDYSQTSLAEQLRVALDAINVSNSLTAELRRAIDALLLLAAQSVGSDVASVLVRDGNEGGLRFLTAISEVKEELIKLRIPPGKGIAGLVFSGGQPMAVADVSEEGSFWSEADEKTGFKTITLLATPLRTGGEMVGVLEFVNRPGAPPYPPFTPDEMDRASDFADAIARIVDAHEIAELIEALFDRLIKASIFAADGKVDSASELRDWLEGVPSAPEHRDLLLLWVTLREIVNGGEAERRLCREVVDSIARFTERRSAAITSYSDF
jgi:GAF domain-containing protein